MNYEKNSLIARLQSRIAKRKVIISLSENVHTELRNADFKIQTCDGEEFWVLKQERRQVRGFIKPLAEAQRLDKELMAALFDSRDLAITYLYEHGVTLEVE